MNPTGAFDPSALDRLSVGRSDAYLDGVVGLFLREAPSRLEEAWNGGRSGDARRTARAAHVLACLAGNVGARTVRDLACAAEAEADRAAATRVRETALPEILFDLEIAVAEARSCLTAARPGATPRSPHVT
jgi:hypothetical protein